MESGKITFRFPFSTFRLLLAAFGGGIGGAEADEQESATAERGGLVAGLFMVGQDDARACAEESDEAVVDFLVLIEGVPGDVVGGLLLADLAVLEESALGEGAEADAENDS